MTSFKSPAQRRYVFRVMVAMAGYMVTLTAAIRLVRDGHMAGPLAWVLAALPGLCVIGVFWAAARLVIEETDEYRRMLLVRQLLVAAGFALSVATVWGFLENAGLVGHVDAFYVAILFFAGLGLGSLYNRLTMGGDGGCAGEGA